MAIHAIAVNTADREARTREVRQYARTLPENSYGRQNRHDIAARETRIATRLRAIERAYRTALDPDANPARTRLDTPRHRENARPRTGTGITRQKPSHQKRRPPSPASAVWSRLAGGPDQGPQQREAPPGLQWPRGRRSTSLNRPRARHWRQPQTASIPRRGAPIAEYERLADGGPLAVAQRRSSAPALDPDRQIMSLAVQRTSPQVSPAETGAHCRSRQRV